MRLIWAILFVLASTPLAAQSLEDTIEGTISAQIDAMREGNFGAAFQYASPGIQRMFLTPENFQMMVEQGYPMVANPAAVEFTGLEMRSGAMVQNVIITDQAGRLFELEYDLIPVDDRWVINGVRILDSQMLGV